jgi:hypothetical protein
MPLPKNPRRGLALVPKNQDPLDHLADLSRREVHNLAPKALQVINNMLAGESGVKQQMDAALWVMNQVIGKPRELKTVDVKLPEFQVEEVFLDSAEAATTYIEGRARLLEETAG